MKIVVVIGFVILVAQKSSCNRENIRGKLLTPEQGCGRRNVPRTRIIGGSVANKGEFPWMAVLLGAGGCGGSLITSRHVLTAAHCLNRKSHSVVLGEHDQETESDGPTQTIRIRSIARHRAYRNQQNDIAILTLERDVEFTSRILPICLPIDDEIRYRNLTGKRATVAGWGTARDGDRDTILRKLQIPVHSVSRCEHIGFTSFNSSSNICAGDLSGKEASCTGDSGGPLMLPISDSLSSPFYEIGIVSYGIAGCLYKGIPSVYASVPFYVDWIKSIVEPWKIK